MRALTLLGLALLSIAGAAGTAHAHESQPGTLDLNQVGRDRYEVVWRAPIYFGRPHPAGLELPEHWKTVVPRSERLLSDSQVFRQVVDRRREGCRGERRPVPRARTAPSRLLPAASVRTGVRRTLARDHAMGSASRRRSWPHG